MKKSKKKIILFTIILIIILFSILIGESSYSKYLTEVKGKGVLQVAKWAFLVNGQTANITNLNLAKTCNTNTLLENRIAPGTRGSFNIEIDARGSEVGIDYNVVFLNEQNKPQNLKFTYEGHTVNNVKELEEFLRGRIDANSDQKVKIMTIEWNWPYETDSLENEKILSDIKDTEDAKKLSKYQFDIVITGTQIEPIA